jgi:predicted ATP-grasp superfamily ATP-dependent carboligase
MEKNNIDSCNGYNGNILLLGSGTQALAILKGLSKAGYRVLCIVNEYGNYADASRYVAKRFLCELPIDSAGFLSYVIQIVGEHGVDVILPMGDIYAEFLSKNKKTLEKYAKFTVPEYSSFLRGYDKNKLMKLCRQKSYPHPLTIDLSTIKDLESDEIKSFPYPAMLKPNCTTGGRGMVLINSYDEFRTYYPSLHLKYGDYHLQKYIREGGRQVKIQLCVDNEGSLICHSALHKVRWYPVKGGASSCSVSIEEKKMTNICHQILKDIGWNGFADFDLIEDPESGQLLIMEINPRLPACIGAAVRAGIEWGLVMVDQAFGHSQKSYTYKKGVTLRHLGFDVLWFLQTQKRFHTVPSWFKFFGKNIFYQDISGWSDPLPFICGTYHNIKKLFDPSFKKSKSI